MEKYLAIVNPAAGGGKGRSKAHQAVTRLRGDGFHVDVAETGKAGDARDIARDAYARGVRQFIAMGGDGTGFEIVNGLFPLAETGGEKPTLGFFPTGTGNSFLRDFSDGGSDYALRAIAEGRRRPCDVLRLTHENGVIHFINLMSFGFTAEVGALRNRYFSRMGELGYILAVVFKTAVLRADVFPMRIDGGAETRDPAVYVSINNSRFTGGKMMMAPAADVSDGLADLIRVNPMGRCELLKTFPKIFKGTHVLHPKVRAERIRSVDFNIGREIDIMIDGEMLRLLPRRLDILPGALEIHA